MATNVTDPNEGIIATVVDPDGYELTVRTTEYGLRVQIEVPDEETYIVADITRAQWEDLVFQTTMGLNPPRRNK